MQSTMQAPFRSQQLINAASLILGVCLFSAVIVNTSTLHVVSHSMAETICPGDYLITDGTGVMRVLQFLRLNGAIRRGDIVVFRQRRTGSTQTMSVKRVIASQSDRVRIHRGELLVNGVRVQEPYVRRPPFYDPGTDSWPSDIDGEGVRDVIVGENAFFLLGDYREESFDSRMIGSISKVDVVGRVLAVIPTGSRDTCLTSIVSERTM